MKKLLLGIALVALTGITANAQSYPTRSISVTVPASAGGPTDTIARIVTARMQQALGQSIIIENVGGASGTIATGKVTRADPDGYTLIIGGVNHFVVNGAVRASDSALATASAEVRWINGWSTAATFEGEFSNVTRSYAGKGVVRYAW